ncbi:MAG: YdbL family protein [Pseudomonadota bacterium]
MMRHHPVIKRLTIALVLTLITAIACSAGEGIKERMKARLPEIVQMKTGGIIGENASGFLEFVTGKTGSQAVVDEENNDRMSVYSAIAAQQGVSVEKVGKLRSLQIVERANPGEYLKNESGVWYQK